MRELIRLPPSSGTVTSFDGNRGTRQALGLGLGTFDAVGLETYLPLIPFFEHLWKKIDAAVDYPEEVAKQRIQGLVTVRLSLDLRGCLQSHTIQIEGNDSLLKSYVLAALFTTLAEPLPVNVRPNGKGLYLNLQFDFQTYTDRLDRPAGRVSGYANNTLVFHKRAWVEGKLNESIAWVVDRFVPPIILLPGGFSIDFVRAYRMLQTYTRPSESAISASRVALLKEKLSVVARRAP